MNVKKFWANLFHNEEQVDGIHTPENVRAIFVLVYEHLVIGFLSHQNGKWNFEYTNEFRKQDEIDVLVDFPDKNKKYEQEVLWPFFAHRIPGLGQPRIQRIIHDEKLDPKNEVELLKRFGTKSIANPFKLTQQIA